MDLYIGRQRWVSFDCNLQSIDEFLQLWLPTRTFAPQHEWIAVSTRKPSQKMETAYGDIPSLLVEWDRMCLELGVDFLDVKNLAMRYNVCGGKWLLFVSAAVVDDTWKLITRALFPGHLDIDIKVLTTHVCAVKPEKPTVAEVKVKEEPGNHVHVDEKPQKGNHVICVYANDFRDIGNVLQIRQALRRKGFRHKS